MIGHICVCLSNTTEDEGLHDFVFAGVWITTGGTRDNDVNRLIGIEIQKFMTFRRKTSGSTPPFLIGFANIETDIGQRENRDAIRNESRNISTANQQVCCRCVTCVRIHSDGEL